MGLVDIPTVKMVAKFEILSLYSVVQEVKSMISKLTIKQLQSWRDPTYYSSHRGGRPQHGEALSSELSESPACILFRKPVGKSYEIFDRKRALVKYSCTGIC